MQASGLIYKESFVSQLQFLTKHRFFLEKTIGLISELRLKFSRVVVASDLLIVGGAGGAPEYLATFHLLFLRGHASVALTREVPARFLRGSCEGKQNG